MEHNIKEIVEGLGLDEPMKQIQFIQTKHRMKLAHFWDIKKGNNVLEIGCGQGDMTAVLAACVGEGGTVDAIDKAKPDYGAPLTLGEAMAKLKATKLGGKIHVEFERDILLDDVHFPRNMYDQIVFSHSSWYMSSESEVFELFKKLRTIGKRLCFAEWSTYIEDIVQYPHLLAAMIQSQYEAYKKSSQANIRTLLTPEKILNLAKLVGWKAEHDTIIRSPDLQDGQWEVQYVCENFEGQMNDIKDMPEKVRENLKEQWQILKNSHQQMNIKLKPLPVFAFTAE